MKVVICGSRSIKDPKAIQRAVDASGFDPITEVVTGGAEGVDKMADVWSHDARIDRTVMYPNWGKYGRSAGYMRNERMIKYADAVIAIWDGKSKGTAHSIQIARNLGKPCYVFMAEPTQISQAEIDLLERTKGI